MIVVPIHAHNPSPYTGRGNWTYLVVGGETTLIDAGEGHEAHLDAIAAALDEARALGARGSLDRVLVTHGHGDHVKGVEALARRWPSASFHKFPWPDGDSRRFDPGWRPLVDEHVVAAGNVGLWVHHTPGHAPDHVVFLEPRSGTLFGGDLVINGSSVLVPASPAGSMRAYLASLARVLDLQPRRILPAHGDPIDNPLALIRHYIRHREARERQVLAQIETHGASTPREIVARVYRGLDARLTAAAVEGVLAHLLKLEEDGRVARCDGERWSLVAGA